MKRIDFAGIIGTTILHPAFKPSNNEIAVEKCCLSEDKKKLAVRSPPTDNSP